uniref:Uncharacterized protein n=1 Tax=Utricularia reniformis TaxID=192314 RepID=A0A1Y0AYX6_9LAMI|nr:hypothetical protein AEK19_MT0825 [Utricularia reniformis]YP_009382313.1 hypothetical protein AEK19_MT1885 [Utricularia reniformis]ART30319.1 hypothetical protein AEK19_MT0825 [Utricularia reniformis]ART30414.1 hypothetical protein AEK19_MT1885 [Utricularia reniformis]
MYFVKSDHFIFVSLSYCFVNVIKSRTGRRSIAFDMPAQSSANSYSLAREFSVMILGPSSGRSRSFLRHRGVCVLST